MGPVLLPQVDGSLPRWLKPAREEKNKDMALRTEDIYPLARCTPFINCGACIASYLQKQLKREYGTERRCTPLGALHMC